MSAKEGTAIIPAERAATVIQAGLRGW